MISIDTDNCTDCQTLAETDINCNCFKCSTPSISDQLYTRPLKDIIRENHPLQLSTKIKFGDVVIIVVASTVIIFVAFVCFAIYIYYIFVLYLLYLILFIFVGGLLF